MSEKIFYQWQNEHLLRTIYPLREIKLRDFLIHFQEIDVWGEFKNKKIENLDEEVAGFKASKAKLVTSTQTEFQDHITYFQGDLLEFESREGIEVPDPVILDKLRKEHNSFEKYFLSYDRSLLQRIYLDRYVHRVENIRKTMLSEIAQNERNLRNVPQSSRVEKWKNIVQTLNNTIPIVDSELNRLYAFSALFKKIKAQKDDLNKRISNKEKERTKIENELRWKHSFVQNFPKNSKTAGFEQDIQQLEEALRNVNLDIQNGLTASIEDRLRAQIERETVSVNDIARWKTELYRQEIEMLDHEQLLEEIVKKFLSDPTRYPLWLQYMVIHFSGMRYRSAHGSWGDPKDLLLSLSIKDIQKEIKQINDEGILTACANEIGNLRRSLDPGADNTEAETHIKRLKSQNPYRRRRALLDYRIDWEKKAIDFLTEEEALAQLEGMKDQLPEWMWKEVVERTPLRLKFATENWEGSLPG